MSSLFRISFGLVGTIWLLMETNIVNAMFMFLFAGIIPGTSIALPFWAMTTVLTIIAYTAVQWLRRDPIYIGDTAYQQQQDKKAARQYVMQKVTPPTTKTRPNILRRRKREYQVATS